METIHWAEPSGAPPGAIIFLAMLMPILIICNWFVWKAAKSLQLVRGKHGSRALERALVGRFLNANQLVSLLLRSPTVS